MAETEIYTRVGIGVMIFKEGKILLAKRKGKHGAGEYAFPGGHLEFMESFEECARRETREETGLEIKNIQFIAVGNTDVFKPRHYVHLGMLAEWASGEPKLMEPDKSEGWAWYALSELPEPLFYGVKLTLDAYKKSKVYYDIADCQNFED